MNDILFCSFYTEDDYYSEKKNHLIERLNKLGIEHQIERMDIPEGMQWSDICRKKITFIEKVCKNNPTKKIFWIDVDCIIESIPTTVSNFSADIIGFARGFSSPLRIGYHLRSRFWEPCFLGINSTEGGRKFISDASRIEATYEGKATDDFFFEESWRKNCDDLSFQIIASSERKSLLSEHGFFVFGQSGKVNEFKGQVAQHSKLSGLTFKQFLLNILDRAGLLPIARQIHRVAKFFLNTKFEENKKFFPSLSYKQLKLKALTLASENKKEKLAQLKESQKEFHEDNKDIFSQAEAIIEYKNIVNTCNTVNLCWWFNPEPGNLGDWLSPYIVSKVGECNVNLVSPARMAEFSSANWICVGSISKFANKNSIVIGAGVSRKNEKLNPNAAYKLLRGPLTGAVVEASGGIDPKLYGDPAIVMPKLYSPSHNIKIHPYGVLVRHFSHLDVDVIIPENIKEISILVSKPEDIEAFIDKLHSYSFVLTSAMHCYILCQAYGIPCGLISFFGFEEKVAGDGMKYSDYSLGVGLKPITPTVIDADMRGLDVDSILNDVKLDEVTIDKVYDHLKFHLKDKKMS